MTLAEFSQTLRQEINSGLREFVRVYPQEHPYALALLGQPLSCNLVFAVATEEGLHETATRYDASGYRYAAYDWEDVNNVDQLKKWLRWSHPDDGWRYRELSDLKGIQRSLKKLTQSGAFGPDCENYEHFLTEFLESLYADREWCSLVAEIGLIVGYCDSDPDEFLRTATRSNPYPLV